jgi:hypothetical protein
MVAPLADRPLGGIVYTMNFARLIMTLYHRKPAIE